MEIALLIVRLGLAGVFGVAGIAKLLDADGSRKALRDFGVPEPLIAPAAVLLPIVELAIAVGLIFIGTSWYAAIAGAVLFAVFTAAMLYQMSKGNAPDCHCFGQIHSEPVGASSIVRNFVLLAAAGVLIFPGASSQGFDLLAGDPQRIGFVVFGLIAIGLLIAVIVLLKQVAAGQTAIMKRIDVLEVVAAEGGQVSREDVLHPHEGLPIGGHFPEFELYDLNAQLITSAAIKDRATATLFMFVSPTCNPCKALLPEIREWRKELLGKVDFVFVSNGKAQDNLDKFGNDPMLPVLLQKGRELAEAVHAQWTPTAILMDSRGKVASHAAAGDTAIRNLIDQIRNEDLEGDFTYFAHDHDHGHSHNRIGERVPEFSVKDIKGEIIDSRYFKGKKTLVAFWSLTCPFCTTMMEELKDWNKTKGKDSPDLVLFSEGDPNAHEALGLTAPIIVEDGYKTAAGLGMFGTPSAVLVDEEGRIVSETAVGAANIWSLVGKR